MADTSKTAEIAAPAPAENDAAQREVPPPPAVAFRCRNCGRLHPAEHAGRNKLPSACVVCGAGVAFDAKGNRTTQPDNWEALADAAPERLDELGVAAEQVTPHAPDHEKDRLHNLERAEAAKAALTKKKALWETKSREDWQKDLDALHAKLDGLPAADENDAAGHAKLQHDQEALRQEIKDLLAKEWTDRDDAHLKKVQEAIDLQGHPESGPPRTFARQGTQRQGFIDKA